MRIFGSYKVTNATDTALPLACLGGFPLAPGADLEMLAAERYHQLADLEACAELRELEAAGKITVTKTEPTHAEVEAVRKDDLGGWMVP